VDIKSSNVYGPPNDRNTTARNGIRGLLNVLGEQFITNNHTKAIKTVIMYAPINT